MSMFHILRAALPAATTDADIDAEVLRAAGKCQSPAVKFLMQQKNISAVEVQSIYIYTSDFIYKEYTAAFRSLQQHRIRPWSDYSFTLRSALRKLEAPKPTHPKPPHVPEYFVV
jgi:hypothetical protein